MYTARYLKYVLNFIHPGGTSRGIMTQRFSWFLILSDGISTGIGECAPLEGLSRDNFLEIDTTLSWLCQHIQNPDLLSEPVLWQFPSILFALETAFLDLQHGGRRKLFENGFSNGDTHIPINGLIWMGSPDYMREQVKHKIDQGFDCLKIKISAAGIDDELKLIHEIRNEYGWDIEIRVDANGSFTFENCKVILDRLASLKIHSIEQPLPSEDYRNTAELCKNTPVPIALDESIVHWPHRKTKYELLDTVKPQFIILKPGLTGGFNESTSWIELAEKRHIGWWITSALESNIGLNAIAQYTAQRNISIKHGLGTGQVFDNNLPSPLLVENGVLCYKSDCLWELKNIGL